VFTKIRAMFPLVDSLTKKPRRRADSIHSLADGLGIGVNKLKRLYTWGVFPNTLVEKTLGGHWRIRNADIPELRARLRLWNFWYRKGLRRLKSDDKQSLTHSHARQEELENLHFAIIQMLGSGFILTVQDSERWTQEIVEASKTMKHNGPQAALPPRGQVMNLKDLNAEGMAFALLQVNVAKLSQKKGRKTIRIKEIAAYMGIGVSTLYRVYGKDRLRAALRPDANERFITTKEERDQAEDAKYSKRFSWRNDDEDETDEDFFDEKTSELRNDL